MKTVSSAGYPLPGPYRPQALPFKLEKEIKSKPATKKYFANFNGLRFLLALLVLIGHVEEIKYLYELKSVVHQFRFIMPMGTVSVSLFFTLSGFLITYFLLSEKYRTQTISVKNFYINRILRIWPLYFFIILLHWWILPHSFLGDLTQNTFQQFVKVPYYLSFSKEVLLMLCLLMLPQLALSMSFAGMGTGFYGAHIWSIGVEELFYLIWPALLKKNKNFFRLIKRLVTLYFGLIMIVAILLIGNKMLLGNARLQAYLLIALSFCSFTRITCMFIGALGAYTLIHQKQNILAWINKKTAMIAFALLFTLLALGLDVPFLIHETYSCCFAVILLYVSKPGLNIALLENPVSRYLGKVSYGIYMYHSAAIFLSIYVINRFLPGLKLAPYNILLYLASISLTILIASLSYELLEKNILKFKKHPGSSNRTAQMPLPGTARSYFTI